MTKGGALDYKFLGYLLTSTQQRDDLEAEFTDHAGDASNMI